MIETYGMKCNLIEIQHCKDRVVEIVKGNKCIGYSGTGDTVTFHFPTAESAMMAFLELDDLLFNVSVSASPVYIDETKLKGVFNYD